MSTTLNEVPWLSELEGFNYRVSQRDELSTEVQRVYDILLAKVQSTLANLTREDVSYGVNIIQLRLVLLTAKPSWAKLNSLNFVSKSHGH